MSESPEMRVLARQLAEPRELTDEEMKASGGERTNWAVTCDMPGNTYWTEQHPCQLPNGGYSMCTHWFYD